MSLPGMSNREIEELLNGTRKMLELKRQERATKMAQFDALGRELTGLGNSIKSLEGTVVTYEQALGLPPESGGMAIADAPGAAEPLSESRDTTRAVMEIVAGRNASGGITIDQIAAALKDQGFEVTREYLHTILNRKKNHQKKLTKDEGKWFLTEKGKEELGIK